MDKRLPFPTADQIPTSLINDPTFELLKERGGQYLHTLDHFEAKVKVAQAECAHPNLSKKMVHDENYHWGGVSGEMVLKAKVCSDCKIVIPRPEGSPWQICHMCWGKMKDDHIVPGQGGREFHYKCESCGHHIYHT
jgi:predicted RNA-binding Zn-ribbon protein involved in translation (DUF1610 family)